MKFFRTVICSLCMIQIVSCGQKTGIIADETPAWSIEKTGDTIVIDAGTLKRILKIDGNRIRTTSFLVASHEVISQPYPEVYFTISRANPNQAPERIIRFDERQVMESTATFHMTDALVIEGQETDINSGVHWVEPLSLNSENWEEQFDLLNSVISSPREGVTRLALRVRSVHSIKLKDVSVTLIYEIYEGHPAIRKWFEVVNNSPVWYRLDKLTLAAIPVGKTLTHIIPMTPDDEAVAASIRSFSSENQTFGLILGSEVPSATRKLDPETGIMGYADPYFEWILGPSERFVSEPVSYYAFSGAVEKTPSAFSTPLDRCVESTYKIFQRDYLTVMADRADLCAPRYCTWSNYGEFITEAIARQIIPIAAQCGFNTFQIDDGWQYDRLGTEPDPEKFPEFDSMCKLVTGEGMTLGLWVSCYRSRDAKDLRVLPEAMALPPIKRLNGYGMGFASAWRNYYAQDIVYLKDRYGAKYFKQDFTNIRLGDMAASHESRSLKESYLRSLRGLLESQVLVRELSPDITTLISHEIYWGTPGVPCDLAVMKNVCYYHIPPNDYAGLGPIKFRKKLVAEYDSLADHDEVTRDLLKGCWHARQRYYAHRGLPLHMLEYYGAATANVRGALTHEIQDRQICSFLMGAPVIYAGDLLSLTPENIEHYRKRFDLLRELQDEYDIYRFFQYSGVPGPTDEDWHWWGKLNKDSEGVVIVLRGERGESEKIINIPWVHSERNYKVTQLFSLKILGTYRGEQLQRGALRMMLPPLGQDILKIECI